MNARRQISIMTCKFSDPALERPYQEYMLTRHAFFDRFALAVGLFVYLSYAVMDMIVLERTEQAVLLRVAGTVVCGAALALVQFGIFRVRLDRLIPLMAVFLGGILNVIIFIEPSIANNYFIGLIQMAVFISFMLRAGFVSSNAAFLFLLGGYLLAISNKNLFGTVQLTTQLYFLIMMFASCSAGIYILERYRRTLFLNSRVIDEQNAQLARMIEELERTVSRKTALLKVFTHVMKTPVHQIIGFLQVVRRELDEQEYRGLGPENIAYAESAAADLRQSVEEMVDYHFVDNLASAAESDEIDVFNIVEEYFYEGIESGTLQVNGVKQVAIGDSQLFILVIKHIRGFFRDRPGTLRSIVISTGSSGETTIDFLANALNLDHDRFRAMTCHLTAIENYLSGEGANPDMALRIVARALERTGSNLLLLDGARPGLRISLTPRKRAAA